MLAQFVPRNLKCEKDRLVLFLLLSSSSSLRDIYKSENSGSSKREMRERTRGQIALKEREISRFTGYRPVLPLVNFQGCLLVNTRHSDCSGDLKGENRQWEMDGIFLLKIKNKREEGNGGNCGEMI